MSKLYKSYLNLKEKDKEKLFIFKSGMFYICLQDDAQKLSDLFGFKITKLNENTIKAGFPVTRLPYYVELLEKKEINFEIIDNDYSKIDNYSDYMNNNKLKEIVMKIKNINLNNITFKQAYEFLEKTKEEIEKIYG